MDLEDEIEKLQTEIDNLNGRYRRDLVLYRRPGGQPNPPDRRPAR